jgi:N-acetylglucosaminyldiphosphoundecaprenol N-acetyl-beta-D-mannosaminyltransferase
MGVGGSFDVISGNVIRAPRWMQDNGLEWLFLLLQEPGKMWKRYLFGNLSYIRITIKAYFYDR